MHMGNKAGKMIWLAAIGIIISLGILLLCTSCTTTPDGIFVEPVDRAYRMYLNQRTHMDVDGVVAMLSYSSSMLRQADVRSWTQLIRLLDEYYVYVAVNKRVNVNYPAAPGEPALQLFRTFEQAWHRNHKGRVKIADAPDKYTRDVNNLIFRIINNEYNR